MSEIVTQKAVRKAIKEGTFIKNGDLSCAEGLKYDFRLGTQILFGKQKPVDVMALDEKERGSLVLRPGELVYVMTKEELDLPADMKAELSLKRKLSHAGILVLGGFCVDPGYKGKLMFALYNLSSTPFPLEPGRKLIAAQFYVLSKEEIPPVHAYKPLKDFPGDLVRLMSIYEPTSVEAVREAVRTLGVRLDDLVTEFRRRREWFDRFKGYLEDLGSRVKELTAGLTDEIENRKLMEKEFRQEMRDIQVHTAKTAGIIATIIALIIAIIGGLAVAVSLKFLFKSAPTP